MITTTVIMVEVVEKKYGIETNFITNAGFPLFLSDIKNFTVHF